MTVDVQRSNERIFDSLVCIDNEGTNVFVPPRNGAPKVNEDVVFCKAGAEVVERKRRLIL